MFMYNANVQSATGFQPYELVYGKKISIPTSFLKSTEPQYNYEDYQYKLKRHMQEAHAIAHDRLLKCKEESKESYDKTVDPQKISIGSKVHLKTSENQRNSKKSRNRRGIEKAVSRLANVLFGSFSRLDIDFIIKKIFELTSRKQQNITLTEDNMRIIQTSLHTVNDTLYHITENQKKLEQNIVFLQDQVRVNTEHIDRIQIKTKLLEQAVLFEIMLNQYAYETQNLMELVNAVINGNIYTNVFTPSKLIPERREIKINLPPGRSTSLPVGINTESLAQLFKVTDVTVIHKDHFLIFVAKIPLITTEGYQVYKPIPLPIQYTNDTIVLVAPEVEYLVLSNDNEKFFILTENQWEACKKVKDYKLCKGSQPVHQRSKSELCEIALLSNKQNIPKSCKIEFLSLEYSITA
jgi:hypothetical protein